MEGVVESPMLEDIAEIKTHQKLAFARDNNYELITPSLKQRYTAHDKEGSDRQGLLKESTIESDREQIRRRIKRLNHTINNSTLKSKHLG